MQRLSLRYRRRYGQVFLKSRRLAERIVRELNVTPEDWVLEVGPGKGILTEILVEKANRVIGVEIDPSLVAYLYRKFSDVPNLEIVNKDIREVKLKNYPDVKVIGNIPYYLSGDFIFYLIENIPYWREAVIMVQKEFGDRLIGKPHTKSYGSITLITQKELDVEFLFYVSKGNFKPVPKVDSVLLRFKPHRKMKDIPFDGFVRLIKASFSTRRKKLLTNLSRELKVSRSEVKNIFNRLNLPLNIRAEELSMEWYARLYHALHNVISDKF